MPYKSKSQLRTCYGKNYVEKGGKLVKVGTWDCEKWSKETKDAYKLPERKGGKKGTKKNYTSKEVQICSKGYKVCYGPRGGAYIIRGGVKIYLSSRGK
jgi:hypothetical protein